jgi:voltage-gated potassium channel
MKDRIRTLLDDTSSPAGRVVGWSIMALIICSSLSVVVETVPELPQQARRWLRGFEILAVAVFTLEYILRIWTARGRLSKALEPLVLLDLLAILPFYVGLFGAGMVDLRVLRILRTVRILRLLKMQRYTSALSMLGTVVHNTRHQLLSFMMIAVIGITLTGSAMYYVEPQTFHSIPHAIWWSVVTLTTVGYGETVPQTGIGRAATAVLMLIGIGIVAIPTGIISAGMVEYYERGRVGLTCAGCGLEIHEAGSKHCRSCGTKLTLS